jgi:hypothetical protein
MTRLIDLLTFKSPEPQQPPVSRPSEDERLRKGERDLAILSGKYPASGADIEQVSEYRLASLMQFPHY